MSAESSGTAELGRIVLVGANGQLGRSISAAWPSHKLAEHWKLIALSRSELDVANAAQVDSVLDLYAPQLLINAAAYTAVDKAESEQEQAFAINAAGPENLARWAAINNRAKLIHVSTDFVFSGTATIPYTEASATAPLGIYGASKLEGEKRVLGELGDLASHAAIVRTSWLYSEYGANFVKTMLRLMQERDSLSVVNDQIGSPTSAHSLAAVILGNAADMLSGSQSLSGVSQWSDGGEISWYDFAAEIQRQALTCGLLSKACELHAIPTSDYPTPAQRPAYSVMDRSRLLAALNCPQNSWQEQLALVLAALGRDNTQ